MIITGNVQVSPAHLSLARDLIVPHELSEKTFEPIRALAAAMHGPGERGEGSLAIMQLSRAGRQSPNIFGGRFPFVPPLGSSEIRVRASLFPKPCLWLPVKEVVGAFVRGARVAAQTGFDGVELHAVHGYLLAQFISPKPTTLMPTLGMLRLHSRTIASWGLVDFVEISGGDYEKPGWTNQLPPRLIAQGVADFISGAVCPPALLSEFSWQSLRSAKHAQDQPQRRSASKPSKTTPHIA
ncbi:hypothetical protein GGX14DRAFT_624355 [Mycena pura]|uniref:NADH:flavin oxidoreductase/NADH oxidase N-terminal domain-containing protein n=1 Tax=Mycena pura TaxID=153505 RepID=A0AAD6VFQ8_9AGAR|nr:hypothetical protein GGX14DRAFT_624355 [Mycena pura]